MSYKARHKFGRLAVAIALASLPIVCEAESIEQELPQNEINESFTTLGNQEEEKAEVSADTVEPIISSLEKIDYDYNGNKNVLKDAVRAGICDPVYDVETAEECFRRIDEIATTSRDMEFSMLVMYMDRSEAKQRLRMSFPEYDALWQEKEARMDYGDSVPIASKIEEDEPWYDGIMTFGNRLKNFIKIQIAHMRKALSKPEDRPHSDKYPVQVLPPS